MLKFKQFELCESKIDWTPVWHGSTEKFDEFDLNKIGSGDGKSLGGWGIYFSESKVVSERYYLPKGQLDQWEIKGNFLDFDSYPGTTEIANEMHANDWNEDDIDTFVNDYDDSNTAKQMYDYVAAILGSEKQASMFFADMGYTGFTMMDRWESDSRNYILLDTSSRYLRRLSIDESVLRDTLLEARGIAPEAHEIAEKIFNGIKPDIFKNFSDEVKNSYPGYLLEIPVSINKQKFNFQVYYTSIKTQNPDLSGYIDPIKCKFENDVFHVSMSLKIKVPDIKTYEKLIFSNILHEAVHAWQLYHIIKSKKELPSHFVYASQRSLIDSSVNTEYGKELIDLLYQSAPHEVSAKLNQYSIFNGKLKTERLDTLYSRIESFLKTELNPESASDIETIRVMLKTALLKKSYSEQNRKDIETDFQNIESFKHWYTKTLSRRLKRIKQKAQFISEKITTAYNVTEDDLRMDFLRYWPII